VGNLEGKAASRVCVEKGSDGVVPQPALCFILNLSTNFYESQLNLSTTFGAPDQEHLI